MEEELAGPRLVLRWRDRSRAIFLFVVNLLWWGAAVQLATHDHLGLGIATAVVAGLPFLYLLGMRILNRTTLEVERGRLVVRTGPLRLLDSPTLLVDAEIDQLFVTATPNPALEPGRYRVFARARDGREWLLASVQTRQHADWLERRIEAHLGLS